MNWHTLAHTLFLALTGAAITLGLAAAIIAYALVRAGDVVDRMRREEREQRADDDAEWLGVTQSHGSAE